MMRKQWVLDKENYNESVKLTLLTRLFNEGFSQPMCKGRDTRCDKSLRHIAAISPLVCTDAGVATSRCDKTLIQCT